MGAPASPFMAALAKSAPAAISALPGADLTWLDAARRRQLDAMLRDGLPGARDEAWKYTPLRALAQKHYALGDPAAATRAVDANLFALPGVAGPQLVFVNGVFRADLSHRGALQGGVSLKLLSETLQTDAETLRFLLGRNWNAASDAFARLNGALATDGVVLRVATGTRVDAPLHIVHVGAPAEAPLAWHARNSIDVGEGASVDVIEHYVGAGAHTHLGTVVTDAVVRQGAELHWLQLQDADAGAVLMHHDYLKLDAAAKVQLHAMELGGALVRHALDAQLRGDGARLQTRGAFVPSGRQHLDTHLDIRHVAINTASDSLWRGVADQRGRGVFHGQIIVASGADGSDAVLSNKNLLLSEHAEIDTQPVLEIYADEVKAAHGATVGQLDERSLFYLRSRGISLAEARALLTVAFCRATLDDMANTQLRDHASALLAARLPGQGTEDGRQKTDGGLGP